MAVAVQVDVRPVLAPSTAQGIMAEDEQASRRLELGGSPEHWPSRKTADLGWIVVAGDQMLAAGEAASEDRQREPGHGEPRSRPDARPRPRVTTVCSSAPPAPRPWRRRMGRVGGTAQRPAMAEMGVGGEPDRQGRECRSRSGGPSCSRSRGKSSAKLQGRWRMSSWSARMSSQPSRQAPGEPGRQNK